MNRILDRVLLGPRRRRRWMERQLAELDRLDQGLRGRRRAGARGGGVVLGATTVFIVGSALMLHNELGLRVSADGVEGTHRLAPEVPVRDGGGSFEFMASAAGRPVTYSPCRRISVRVNDRLQPPGADGIIEEAVSVVSAASGLLITVDGTTDELPDRDRIAPPSRSGPPPVLIAWTTPEQNPELLGRTAGVGGSQSVAFGPAGPPRYVAGTVSLDTPALGGMLGRPGGRALVRAVLMHELGHVVGLAHVADPRELMHEDNLGVTRFGPGDLEGLARLGQGDCF